MKKRILSLLLTAVMLLSLFPEAPLPARAAEKAFPAQISTLSPYTPADDTGSIFPFTSALERNNDARLRNSILTNTLNPDLLVGQWKGSCWFTESDGNAYNRNMTLTILNYDSGVFTGVFDYLIPAYRGGLHGSYYLEGTLDESSGSMTFQGIYMLIDDGYYNHSSYSIYNGTLNLEQGIMNYSLGTVSFSMSRANDEKYIEPSSVVGTYVGFHHGSISGNSVLRNSTIVIESCTDRGDITGCFYIYPIPNAPDQINGIYAFSGFVNLFDGTVSFIGTSWVEFPDVPGQYVFEHYIGTISSAGNTITGHNGNGYFFYQSALTEEIVHLIFADLSYARIPTSCKGYTVNEWLAKKTYQNISGKAGYNKKEMEDDLLFDNSDLNRVKVYEMVGDWTIVDVIDGEAGYAANIFQKGNDIIIAYRGSEEGPASIGKGEDWWVDAEFAIFNVLDGRQFQAALDTYYTYAGKGNVTLTGHSLGGALVTYVSTITGAKGYSFDGAAGHVIDLIYLYEPMNIDFHSKDQMNFINYTDPKQLKNSGADLIQHTNEDLFPGICYYTNENAKRYNSEFFWTHQQYSNTIPCGDGSALAFMPLAEEHRPKDNWYASADYDYLGIAVGGFAGLIAGGVEGKGINVLNILKGTAKGLSWGHKLGRLVKAGSVHLGTVDGETISVKKNIREILDISAAVTENVIYGGDGTDILIGAAGPDVLVPGRLEGDTLIGGSGNDVYLLDTSLPGSVYISDNSGSDVIQLKSDDSPNVTYLGYDTSGGFHRFSIGSDCTVYLAETLRQHSLRVMNCDGLVFGFIDSKGGCTDLNSRGVLRVPEEEGTCKEVSVEGECTIEVLDPNGNLSASYSTTAPGLYTEAFGTVYISAEEGSCLLTATLYEDYSIRVDGEDEVDVAIIGTDEENYVDRSTWVEKLDLNQGEALVVPEQHLVTQADQTVAAQEQVKTVSVTISQTELEAIVGETLDLSAEAVFPDGTTTDAIFWASANPEIVTCEKREDGSWILMAADAGEAEIYAVAGDSGFSASCVVKTKYSLPCSGGVSCAGKHFEDTPEKNNWAHDAIDWAIVHEVTTGTSSAAFSPNRACTRAQVVTFLWRAYGSPEPSSTENSFTDVAAGCYYDKAVRWAVEKGITAGTSAASFSPNRPCTRAQAVTFLWRAAGSPEPGDTENAFPDVKAGSYYEKAVRWAVENEITNGTTGTTFSPNMICSRAQVVTFLYRTLAD